ncbi:hypothetical protein B0J13DRAFT_116703 [Dactylonectria estremocensis]|uniref:Uncharacterized protein n=1 Tax=Dactylonectria estremocensis TaxID=1079267 RepID=A0A9P9FEC6_9HYPO|nr:hypothetical protein B0J13DRAFT_116703 [Dactylonectria estremocensis]
MGSRFTDEERRFLLAEMIKANCLEIEVIRRFVKAHVVEPNWMQMQLPLGRNMDQCVQAAHQLGFKHHAWPKRKMSGDQSEPAAKRIALPGNTDPSAMFAGVPSTAPTHVAILPRPASNAAEIPSMIAPQAPPPTVPKKKGRPARADKARFRPILPQHIAPAPAPAPAPRPAEQGQHSPQSQHSYQNQEQNEISVAPPRTILPSGAPGQDSTSTPPNNYSPFYTGSATGRRSLLRGGTPVDETAHPASHVSLPERTLSN